MARKLDDGILQSFCRYCEGTEVPSTFALWTGISMVSAAMGRDCFIDYGFFTVHPNLYVILVAGSAKCRKSTAIGIGLDFLQKIDPPLKILSQKMTTEALIGALSGMTGKDDTTLVLEAEGIIVVDELSTFVDKNAFKTGMIALLTKLYDSKDFTYETRSRGVEHVQNPCLSVLGGSTTQWIKEAVPVVAVGGGFTSRVVFVYRDTRERSIARPRLTEENRKRGLNIVHDLNEVCKMRGPFDLTDGAWELFEKEYHRFGTASPLFDSPNLSGYANRRHTTLLKIAMAVSASTEDSRLVNEKDFGIALRSLELVEVDMHKVLSAINREVFGQVLEEVMTVLVNRTRVTRGEMVRVMKDKISSRELNEIMDTLEEAGYIKVERVGQKQIYVLLKGR